MKSRKCKADTEISRGYASKDGERSRSEMPSKCRFSGWGHINQYRGKRSRAKATAEKGYLSRHQEEDGSKKKMETDQARRPRERTHGNLNEGFDKTGTKLHAKFAG